MHFLCGGDETHLVMILFAAAAAPQPVNLKASNLYVCHMVIEFNESDRRYIRMKIQKFFRIVKKTEIFISLKVNRNLCSVYGFVGLIITYSCYLGVFDRHNKVQDFTHFAIATILIRTTIDGGVQ